MQPLDLFGLGILLDNHNAFGNKNLPPIKTTHYTHKKKFYLFVKKLESLN